MSHDRWMHLRVCRKRTSSTSEFRVRTREEPDSADLFRLRRPSRERRKSETNRANDHEPDQPHGHLGGGWLAGSLADDCCSQELAALVEHGLFVV